MAKTTKNKTQTTNQDSEDAHGARLNLLQKSVDDCCSRIADGGARSFTDRAIKSRSVADSVIEAGFAAMEAAIADGRARYAASRKNDEVGAVSRVDLTTL